MRPELGINEDVECLLVFLSTPEVLSGLQGPKPIHALCLPLPVGPHFPLYSLTFNTRRSQSNENIRSDQA